MSFSRTPPLSETSFIEHVNRLLSDTSSDENHENREREAELIMQSAQGFYFGAFARWLNDRLLNRDLFEYFNAQDLEAGEHRDALVNDYIGMESAEGKIAKLGYKTALSASKDRTLELLTAAHGCFKRQIAEGNLHLSCAEHLADILISQDNEKLHNKKLSKQYKKMSNWLLNFDEACNIFISTFVSIAEKHHDTTGRDFRSEEYDLVTEKLVRFLNGVAHLPRQHGMPKVHQIDICGQGVDLLYGDDKLTGIKFASTLNLDALNQLHTTPVTRQFLESANQNTVSTGCPAVHHASSRGHEAANLLQISMYIFRDHLRQALFGEDAARVKWTFPLRVETSNKKDSLQLEAHKIR